MVHQALLEKVVSEGHLAQQVKQAWTVLLVEMEQLGQLDLLVQLVELEKLDHLDR